MSSAIEGVSVAIDFTSPEFRGPSALARRLLSAQQKAVIALLAQARQLAPDAVRGTAVVYFLRLKSGMPYIGASTDLEARILDRAAGRAGKTTARDAIVAVLRVEMHGTFTAARQREAQLKRWSRGKKALISGDFDQIRGLSRSRET